MAWFNKQEPSPSYLNDEQEFVRSASKAQRKAFVEQYENRFWKGFTDRYKWDTKQNLSFMDKLKREPDLLQKYEAARRGVIWETKANLLSFRKTTQADIKSVNEYKRKASAWEVAKMGWEAKNRLDQETQFKDINNRLFAAWAKDLDGGMFDNGLLGALTKPSSKLNKALLGIEQDYGTQVKRNIELGLAQHRNLMMQLEGASKGQQWAMSALLSPFGYKNQTQVLETMTNSRYIRNDIKGRLPAIASTLLVLGISSALGNPSLYLGNLKLPISVQNARSPSKDIAAYALFGSSARSIENNADVAIGKYVDKTAKLNEKDTKKNRGSIDATLDSLDPNIDMNAQEAGWQEGARTNKFRLIRHAELAKLTNPNVDDYDKYGLLVRNPDLLKNPQMRKLQQRILQKYWLNLMQNARGGTLELAKMMVPCVTAQEFIDRYAIPDPRIAKYVEQFYKTLDGQVLQHIVDGADTPGAVDMINAYTKKGKELSGYLNGINNRSVRSIDKRNKTQYAGNIDDRITNKEAVADYIQNTAVSGVPLENTYSKQISQLIGIDWNPQYIVNQIRKNGVYVTNFSGVNTGRNQENATRMNYNNKPALVTAIGSRKNGQHGYQLIGIKWDCANIIVGGWYPDSEFVDNGKINIPLRLPLVISLGKPDRPQKEQNPNEPWQPTNHPNSPGTPTGNPNSPGQSLETPISIPGGTNWTGSLGGWVNSGTAIWPTTPADFWWPVNPTNIFWR